jgi:peroxiredoxin family protein
MGPIGGTYAASWMSSIALANGVGVQAGTTYAGLQALGMTVTAFSPVAAVVGGGAGIYCVARYRSML